MSVRKIKKNDTINLRTPIIKENLLKNQIIDYCYIDKFYVSKKRLSR